MKHEIPIRIIVEDPLEGVAMLVQRGKDELLAPSDATAKALFFDLEISVDLSGSAPNFLGKYAQGPKDARFVYVNSGTYAGHAPCCWGRRAKISLMSITEKQVKEVLDGKASRIVTSFPGIGRDGGPTCASVKGIEWKTVKK